MIAKVIGNELNGVCRVLRLEDGSTLCLQRGACVSVGDEIEIRGRRKRRAFVLCKNGRAKVYPPYCSKAMISLGDIRLPVFVKEITTDEEFEAYCNLADFHYRSKKLFGKSTTLVMVPESKLLPPVLGYIELTTSFFMNKARQRILDAHFSDGKGVVHWESWDVETGRMFTNVMVRIARTVVHPEFRGLGIGGMLVTHACAYAKERWQVSGLKPYFLEITADMLKFVPFVQKAGLRYIGMTEGNLHRVRKDMEYIVKNIDRVNQKKILRKESGGIIQLQVKYARNILKILEVNGMDMGYFGKHLISLEESIPPDEYAVLHGILRFPKPTYMIGLTRRSQAFLSRRLAQLDLSNSFRDMAYVARPISRPIYVKDLTVKFVSSVTRTKKTSEVQEAFGIIPEHLDTVVFEKLSLEISPGATVLLTGASGSGKTTLIKLLTGQLSSSGNIHIKGMIDIPDDAVIGTFNPITSNEPLVELLGRDELLRALYALNISGLTEAQLYLRRYAELSNGQQYRAMIANLIDSEANVWVADEFCSALDQITANTVVQNIRKHVRRAGITAIVASPYPQPFLSSLQPDIVVNMSSTGRCRVYSGTEFAQMLQDNQLLESTDYVQAKPLATDFARGRI